MSFPAMAAIEYLRCLVAVLMFHVIKKTLLETDGDNFTQNKKFRIRNFSNCVLQLLMIFESDHTAPQEIAERIN